MLTEAYSEFNILIQSIEQTLNWDCAQNLDFQTKLNDQRDALIARTTDMHSYNEG